MEYGKKWFLMDFVKDRYIEEAFPKKCAYFDKIGLGKTFRIKWLEKTVRAMCVAAGFFLFLILWFGATYPTTAAKLPIVGRMFQYIQEKLEFSGNYEGYADEVGTVYSNNGISVTISEIYCDGTVLIISYKIESKTAFQNYSGDTSTSVQMHYDGESVMNDNGNIPVLTF